MSKVSLADQIEAVRVAEHHLDGDVLAGLAAAHATLKLFAKYEPEVRDLLTLCIKRDEVLPGSEIRVLTPHSTAVSAIGSADAVKKARNPEAPCPVCGDKALHTDFYDQCYACGRNVGNERNASATADSPAGASTPSKSPDQTT